MHDVFFIGRNVHADARADLVSAGEPGRMIVAHAVIDRERVGRRPLVLRVQPDLPTRLRNVCGNRRKRSACIEHAEGLVRGEDLA